MGKNNSKYNNIQNTVYLDQFNYRFDPISIGMTSDEKLLYTMDNGIDIHIWDLDIKKIIHTFQTRDYIWKIFFIKR